MRLGRISETYALARLFYLGVNLLKFSLKKLLSLGISLELWHSVTTPPLNLLVDIGTRKKFCALPLYNSFRGRGSTRGREVEARKKSA